MYMTWDAFFPFCMLLLAVISFVIDIHNKKR